MGNISERIKWIDVYKGIGIILVVIGHTGGPWGATIYLFHMAAFFFISGYSSDYDKYGFSQYFLKKFSTILLPVIFVNLLYIVLRYFIDFIGVGKYIYTNHVGVFEFLSHIKLFFTTLIPQVDMASTTWFLIVLFQASIIGKIMYQMDKRFKTGIMFQLSISFILYFIYYYMVKVKVILPFYFNSVMIASFFLMSGGMFKFLFNRLLPGIRPVYLYIMSIPLFGVSIYILYYFTEIKKIGTIFFLVPSGHIIYSQVAAFSGILLLILISIVISKINYIADFFIYICKGSLTIIFFHFLVFRIIFIIFVQLGYSQPAQMFELVPQACRHHWIQISIFGIAGSLLIHWFITRSTILSAILLGKNDYDVKMESFFNNKFAGLKKFLHKKL